MGVCGQAQCSGSEVPAHLHVTGIGGVTVRRLQGVLHPQAEVFAAQQGHAQRQHTGVGNRFRARTAEAGGARGVGGIVGDRLQAVVVVLMPPGQLRRRHYAAVRGGEGTLQLGAQVALERSGVAGVQVQRRAIAAALGVAVLAQGAVGQASNRRENGVGQPRAEIDRVTGHRGSDVLHAVVLTFGRTVKATEVDFTLGVVLVLDGTERQVQVPRISLVTGITEQAIGLHVGGTAGVVAVVVDRGLGVAEQAAGAPAVVECGIGTQQEAAVAGVVTGDIVALIQVRTAAEGLTPEPGVTGAFTGGDTAADAVVLCGAQPIEVRRGDVEDLHSGGGGRLGSGTGVRGRAQLRPGVVAGGRRVEGRGGVEQVHQARIQTAVIEQPGQGGVAVGVGGLIERCGPCRRRPQRHQQVAIGAIGNAGARRVVTRNAVVKGVGVVVRPLGIGLNHHVALALGKTIAAQLLQTDRGARSDVRTAGHHQAPVAGVGVDITGGHGIVGHAEDQAGVAALGVIAVDMDRVIDLQRGRQVGHRMDRVTRNVDVVIEQQVARAEYQVREAIGDLTDVAGAHTTSACAGQDAEHRAGAAIDRQVLRSTILNIAGNGSGVVDSAQGRAGIVKKGECITRDEATVAQRPDAAGVVNARDATDGTAIAQRADAAGVVYTSRASAADGAAIDQCPDAAGVANPGVTATDGAACVIVQRGDGAGVANPDAAAADGAAVAQCPDAGAAAVVNTRAVTVDTATSLIVQRGDSTGVVNTSAGTDGAANVIVQRGNTAGVLNTVDGAAVAQRLDAAQAVVENAGAAAADGASRGVAQRGNGAIVVNADVAAADDADGTAVAQCPDAGAGVVDNARAVTVDTAASLIVQ